MNAVIELQGMLLETQDLLAHLEQAVQKNPHSIGLRINSQSAAKRFQELEGEFQRIAAESSIDVCRYRLFGVSHDTKISVLALTDTLREFQKLFSTAYGAIKHGPRSKPVDADIAKETSLNFGYSFAGSVGVVMTLENRKLLVESSLDAAMQGVFDIAKARTEQEVVKASATLGGPTVRALYNWVTDHLSHNLGVDVQWVRGPVVKGSLTLQVPELKQLATVLQAASEPVDDEVVFDGTVEGCEHRSSLRFHFLTDDGTEIKCPYKAGVISKENPLKSPARYRATFKKKAKKIIATNQDVDASYLLIKLQELS